MHYINYDLNHKVDITSVPVEDNGGNAVGRSVSVDVDHRENGNRKDLGRYRLRKTSASAPSCSDSTSTMEPESRELSQGVHLHHLHHHHHADHQGHHRLHSRHSQSETLTMTVPAADHDDDTSSWVSAGGESASIGDLGDLDSGPFSAMSGHHNGRSHNGRSPNARSPNGHSRHVMFKDNLIRPDLDNGDSGRVSTEYDSSTSSMCSELDSHFRNEVDVENENMRVMMAESTDSEH